MLKQKHKEQQKEYEKQEKKLKVLKAGGKSTRAAVRPEKNLLYTVKLIPSVTYCAQ